MKRLAWALLTIVAVGCGGASAYEQSPASAAPAEYTTGASGGWGYRPAGAAPDVTGSAPSPGMAEPEAAPAARVAADYGGGDEEYEASDDDGRGGGDRAQYAQAQPPPPQVVTPAHATGEADQAATDATSGDGPLLIYQATLHMSVFEVEASQRAIIQIAQEVGGFLAEQSDTTVVIRIPARRFREAIGRVEEVGDILHRNVQAIDVSEEFRDVAIRLRNAEAIRERLERLLQRTNTVAEALQVERELERITMLIETLKGRLRFLSDRIMFSTITVNFTTQPRETIDQDVFRLPFEWLDRLGLRNLLDLR